VTKELTNGSERPQVKKKRDGQEGEKKLVQLVEWGLFVRKKKEIAAA